MSEFEGDIPITIKIQIDSGAYEEAIKKINELKKSLMELGSVTEKVSRAFAPVERASKDAADGIKINGKSVKELAREQKNLDGVMKAVRDRFATTRKELLLTATGLEFISRGLLTAQEHSEHYYYILDKLGETLNVEREVIERKIIPAYAKMLKQKNEAIMVSTAVSHAVGVTGEAWRMLGRSVFWTGLGMMFIVMSLQRVNRALYGITLAARSVIRAQRSLREAQREYTRTVLEFGRTSPEARAAYERILDAQEAVEYAQIRAREANENYINSLLMLIFGTVPTAIRSFSDLTVSIRTLVAAYTASRIATSSMSPEIAKLIGMLMAEAGVTQQLQIIRGKEITTKGMIIALTNAESIAQAKNTAARAASIGPTVAATAANKGLSLSLLGVAAATGIGIAAVVAWIVAMKAATDAMNEAYKSSGRLENSLTGHSLVDSIRETTSEVNKLAKAFRSLPIRSHSPLEIKTTYGWANIGEIGLGDVKLSPAAGVTNVNINIQGPFYIREEADVDSLARAVVRKMNRGVRSRVGGVL